MKRYLICLLMALSGTVASPFIYAAPPPGVASTAHESRFIVVWKNATAKTKATANRTFQVNSEKPLKHLDSIGVYEKSSGQSLKDAMAAMQAVDGVEAVYPDNHIEPFQLPNDPSFDELWGLSQSNDVDINAPLAWDSSTGSDTVYVGVIDTGVDVSHEDLAANIWTNPGEIAGNGIDDDGNGWVDDVHGVDTLNYDGTPEDDVGHGTHVAGTIAAVGNNDIGVAGVTWNTKIIPCKFMDEFGGYDSGAIACLDYMLTLKADKGLDIIATNNSWGSYSFSQPLYDAIQSHANNGILFIAAAGNDAVNNNQYSSYPASYSNANIIAVASHGRTGELSSFSNYGSGVVDIAAPGEDIYSTIPDDQYAYYSGTSMATPHVTGAIALLRAMYPDSTALGLRSLLLNAGVDRTDFSGQTDYGRLRLANNDGSGAIACGTDILISRIEPLNAHTDVPIGTSVLVRFSSSRCGEAGSPVVLHSSNGETLTLTDDGEGADAVANDGIFSIYIHVDWSGSREFVPEGDEEETFNLNGLVQPVVTQVSYRWETPVSTTALALTDDSYAAIPLDFDLQSPNGTITTLYASSNGLVFGSNDVTRAYQNLQMPFDSSEEFYSPFWADLTPSTGTEYRYGVVGSAPSRKLVVEFSNVYFYGVYTGDATVTFQVVFSEDSPVVYFNYQDVTVDSYRSGGATVAVGYQHDGYRETWSRNSATLSDNMSLMVAVPGVIDTAPEIYSVETSGIARVGYPVTVTLDVPATNPDGTVLEVDMGDGSGYRAYSSDTPFTYTYSEAGVYTLVGRVTYESSYSTASTSLSILALSDLEMALIDAARNTAMEDILAAPDEYGLITQAEAEQSQTDAVAAAETATAAATLTAVTSNPQDYGLISQADAEANSAAAAAAARQAILDDPQAVGLTTIVTTSEDIGALAAGTHLVGASTDITNLASFFGDVRFVWVFQDGVFKGWSPDADLLSRLQNSGYGVLTSISAGQGFWVSK